MRNWGLEGKSNLAGVICVVIAEAEFEPGQLVFCLLAERQRQVRRGLGRV